MTLVHDVRSGRCFDGMMSVLMSLSANQSDVIAIRRGRIEHFLTEKKKWMC